MDLPVWYWPLSASILGAVFASFAAVLIERIPARRSLNGRSTCVCGRRLRAFENIPVLGWALLGGRSRCCKARIPVWYVLLEAGTGLVAALATWRFGPAGMVAVIALVVAGSAGLGLRRRQSAG